MEREKTLRQEANAALAHERTALQREIAELKDKVEQRDALIVEKESELEVFYAQMEHVTEKIDKHKDERSKTLESANTQLSEKLLQLQGVVDNYKAMLKRKEEAVAEAEREREEMERKLIEGQEENAHLRIQLAVGGGVEGGEGGAERRTFVLRERVVALEKKCQEIHQQNIRSK